jgi:aconitate hydratase
MSEAPLGRIEAAYKKLAKRTEEGRQLLGRSLTLTEKILIGHLDSLVDEHGKPVLLERRKSTVALRPDRVAMQDATAQMAMLQFMHAGMDEVAVPSTVHCDHLIRAHVGAKADLKVAIDENDEVYSFLKTASQRYGIGFWEPGAGIIHQVVLENYAFPGGMMVGTDSHTPNAGGLGMMAIGVGGADAVDVMVGQPFGLRWPGVIGVRLTGQLNGWASAKDVILRLMGILTVKGGTSHVVEFFGPGADSMSATGKGTICNMGAEHGATTSVFPFDARMAAYLEATGRAQVAALAKKYAEHLRPDEEVVQQPEKFYDRVIDIDLSTLEPHIVGPHSPDVARPVSMMKGEATEKGFPEDLKFTLIGSCTNSSYEDIGRAAHVAQQAQRAGLKAKVPLMVTPGSDQIHNTILRDGQMKALESVGATVLANACGPCIGQWKRDDIKKGEKNAILTSYNRNFRGRNDENVETLSFIASPELVVAMAFSGKLGFNPLTDTMQDEHGNSFRFAPPSAAELPKNGFAQGLGGFVAAPEGEARKQVHVKVDPKSNRLQVLERFSPWDGKDLVDLPVLLKAQGKCTTDHISAAGKWLVYRGHLENISDNMFIGAINAFTGEAGKGLDVVSHEEHVSFPAIARHYKKQGLGWVVFGDENYGEGSSREHAAMSPRHLGGKAIIVRSFARIHETNLKKQGMLPLTFKDAADYDKVQADDRVSISGLTSLAPDRPLTVTLTHKDKTQDRFEVQHTMTPEQIGWFKAGSALNRIAEAVAGG